MKASDRRDMALRGLEHIIGNCKAELDKEQRRLYRYQLSGAVDIAIRVGAISEKEGEEFIARGKAQ